MVIIHDILGIKNFSSWYRTRSLRSLVRYRVEHTKRIPYLRAPMYYSLCILRTFPVSLTG